MIRRTLIPMALIAISITVAACSSDGTDTTVATSDETETTSADTGDTSEPRQLSILTKFGVAELSPYFEGVAAAYEELHPGVSIELIQETDQSVKDKTKTLTASGALTDIYFTWTGNWAENFIVGGLASDLTSEIAPETEWGSTFGQASTDAFVYEDKHYAIPLYNNGKFMGYNMEIFAEVGLDVPETFEDLIAACPVIRAAGYEPIAFGNKDGWPALHYLQQLFAYNIEWETLTADFKPATAVLDDPGYVKSMNEFKTLVDECTDTGAGSNGVLYSTAQQALAGGASAMYYQEILEFDTVTGSGGIVTPENFGIFPLPAPADSAGDVNAIEGAPEGYMINAQSPQIDLAVDFMKFATNEANATVLSAPPYGQPSAVIGAVSPETSSVAVIDGIAMVNSASRIVIWLDTVTVPAVADAWLAGGEALISGSATAEDVLNSVREASLSEK